VLTGILVACVSVPVWAQLQVTIDVRLLDVDGNPPALEGSAMAVLQDQSSGGQHPVVFGGCTQDSLSDQVLVFSDVNGGFGDMGFEVVFPQEFEPSCEHVVAGTGEVAYAITGYVGDFNTLRTMEEALRIELNSSVLTMSRLDIQCLGPCPADRVGAAGAWLDSAPSCEGGGVLVTGGTNEQFQILDDAWLYCPESSAWLAQPDLEFRQSDHVLLRDERVGFDMVKVAYDMGSGGTTMEVSLRQSTGLWDPIPVTGVRPPAVWGAGGLYLPQQRKVYLWGGTNAQTGETVDTVWEFDLRTHTWRLLPSQLQQQLANMVNTRAPSGDRKSDGTTRALVFGGVEDWSPRTLSNKTYLVTATGPEQAADVAVPALARLRGAGAFFTSLMHLFNAGETDLELEMVFTPRKRSGGEVTTVSHTVPAGVLQTIQDPLETLFGFSGTAGRVGSLLITVDSGSADDLMVQTVVFAQLDSGEEYGQFFPALGMADAISAGQTAYLNTTEDPVVNRVNVGLMAVVDGTRFRVTPVDPLGHGLATPKTYDLDKGGNTQINNIHDAFGLGTMADVVMEVEVVTGSGLTYVSVLDGNLAYPGTSDPTTILPVLGGSEEVCLLEIGSIQGRNEFSGSASITNYSDFAATVQADFLQRGIGGVTATEMLNIPAGDTLGFTDLGGDLFGVYGDVGTVVLTATNEARIGATGREFAIFRDDQEEIVGTAGQLIAGQTDDDRLDPGRTYHFIGLRQAGSGSMVERSHFAVYNPTDHDANVQVRLYDGASGASEGQRTWTVGPETLIQVNNVIRAINPQHDDGEKRIEVEVSRGVYMNAFRVNVWGDPVTLGPFEE
jgi:hypothetical protein